MVAAVSMNTIWKRNSTAMAGVEQRPTLDHFMMREPFGSSSATHGSHPEPPRVSKAESNDPESR
jgi:hypothetical protein